MKNVYVEVEYSIDQLIGYEGRTSRYMIPVQQCIEWFEDVIADEEEIINVEEMIDDYIVEFIEHWASETVWTIHEYYLTDYDNIEQMDRDKKLKELLNGKD